MVLTFSTCMPWTASRKALISGCTTWHHQTQELTILGRIRVESRAFRCHGHSVALSCIFLLVPQHAEQNVLIVQHKHNAPSPQGALSHLDNHEANWSR